MPTSHRHLGARLRRLRQQQGLSQAELARRLQLSPSYLNQIERNQRPLTADVQHRLQAVLGGLEALFEPGDPAALAAPLGETLRALGHGEAGAADLRALAGDHPQVAQALLDLHRQHRQLQERAAALELQFGHAPATAPLLPPGDQVRDYFNRAHNHIAELDLAAEALHAELAVASPSELVPRLRQRLAERHGLQVRALAADDDHGAGDDKRVLDPAHRTLWLADHLKPGQQAFQLAAQLALLDYAPLLDARIADAGFDDAERTALMRIGLSNYFAGALVMPYADVLASARAWRYDIDRLAQRFGVGFEAVCHRLSTLQRPGATGLPIFFLRVDRAGNVSKRHSSTDFHFSHVGGSCPLWIVYEAFNQPGRVLTQIARMPDGRRYFWLARQVSSGEPGYGRPRKTFALTVGCDLRHADQLVYARGWDLDAVDDAVPIGPGCLTCERAHCVQRAFPALPPLRTSTGRDSVAPRRAT